MKKNGWILVLFVLLGLLAGALVSRWLEEVPGLAFLTRTKPIEWTPAANFAVIAYDFHITINISLLSIAGAAVAIWLYRKM